jgi:hypothetical protein
VAINLVWHVIWAYIDANGKLLQYPEQAGDFICTPLATEPVRPDLNDLKNRIANNFATPGGAFIAIRLVSSAQSPAIFT